MSNETIAWKICYTDNGQYRTVLSEHNSVGDYRAIDPMASSIALCAAPVSAEPVANTLGKIRVGRLPTINQDGYPGLGDWWVQLRIGSDGDEVLARVYGDTPGQAYSRAAALAAGSSAPVPAQAQQPVSVGEPPKVIGWYDPVGGTYYPNRDSIKRYLPEGRSVRPLGYVDAQPVSGADGLPSDSIPGAWAAACRMAADIAREAWENHVYATGLEGMYERCREMEQVLLSESERYSQLCGNTGQLDHLPDAAQMIEPSGNSGELNFQAEYEAFKDAAWNKSGSPIGLMDGKNAAWWAWVNRAALAQQDAEKVDAALAEMIHAMFRSGNSVPVTRITIDRKQYEATIDTARKENSNG